MAANIWQIVSQLKPHADSLIIEEIIKAACTNSHHGRDIKLQSLQKTISYFLFRAKKKKAKIFLSHIIINQFLWLNIKVVSTSASWNTLLSWHLSNTERCDHLPLLKQYQEPRSQRKVVFCNTNRQETESQQNTYKSRGRQKSTERD